MGCGSCSSHGCGTTSGGLPKGCRNNGSCTSGGCNRLNTFDWLTTIDLPGLQKEFDVVEVSFNDGSRKDFYRNIHTIDLLKNEMVMVESTTGGYDIGSVSLKGELVRMQMKKKRVDENSKEIGVILRKAGSRDLEKRKEVKAKESESLIRARVISRSMKLEMKISSVEYQSDGKKATFYYTADGRVDFRELIKEYAKQFHVKVEMRQIGIRQEAGKIGGIGSCGRELCCSTWLTDFKSVSTTAARYQNLAINQAKLSGQCGRLKCCLNYELNSYMDALQYFPQNAEKLMTHAGEAYLQKTDIFKKLMFYAYPKSDNYYPLNVDTVKNVLAQNARGEKPAELKDIQFRKAKEELIEYSDTVGQTTLSSLNKKQKGKSKKRRR